MCAGDLHEPRCTLNPNCSCAQVTCLNLAGYGLRGAALGLNNVLGAPLLPPLAFLQGLDLHNNQLWGACLPRPQDPQQCPARCRRHWRCSRAWACTKYQLCGARKV